MNTSLPPSFEASKKYDTLIRVLSFAIPLVVALLFGIRQKIDLGSWTKILPHLNAILNSLTALALIAGYFFIKAKNTLMHKRSMTIAFAMGSLFLVSYVLYHFTNPNTSYGGEGALKTLYYVLLISHIILAGVVVPFVLYALYYAWTAQFAKHVKWVKWTLPIWLYVSVTGVIVYLMISPYYA
jgi:putative membrane protein